MSCSIHFASKIVSGYGIPDGRYVPRPGVAKRAIGIPLNSSLGYYSLISNVNFLPSGCHFRRTSISYASSNSYRRDPDFSKQNKNGFPRNKNWPNEEINGYHEDSDESHSLTSKNGSLLGNQEPNVLEGSKEKEILEVLRKVQAQLRQRYKEKKKVDNLYEKSKENKAIDNSNAKSKENEAVDNSNAKSKENKAVDSLLKLLKNHAGQPGNKNISSTEENITVKHEIQESPRSNPSRPKSSFSKRSPVPHANLVDPSGKGISLGAKNETKTGSATEQPFSGGKVFVETLEDEIYDDNGEDEQKRVDVSKMTVVELRALAKSRGVRGFTRLKKHELIEVLSRSSI